MLMQEIFIPIQRHLRLMKFGIFLWGLWIDFFRLFYFFISRDNILLFFLTYFFLLFFKSFIIIIFFSTFLFKASQAIFKFKICQMFSVIYLLFFYWANFSLAETSMFLKVFFRNRFETLVTVLCSRLTYL